MARQERSQDPYIDHFILGVQSLPDKVAKNPGATGAPKLASLEHQQLAEYAAFRDLHDEESRVQGTSDHPLANGRTQHLSGRSQGSAGFTKEHVIITSVLQPHENYLSSPISIRSLDPLSVGILTSVIVFRIYVVKPTILWHTKLLMLSLSRTSSTRLSISYTPPSPHHFHVPPQILPPLQLLPNLSLNALYRQPLTLHCRLQLLK